MANRRTLKKQINYICSELFAECVSISAYHTKGDSKDVDNLMTRILLMHDEFIARISHTEPGNSKLFYKKLREDFAAQVDDVLNAITHLC